MQTERKSINMPVELLKDVGKRVGEKSQKFSLQVCNDLTTFYTLLDEIQKTMQGKFTLAEIKAICHVMKGTPVPDKIRLLPQLISLNLSDAQTDSTIAEKFGFDFLKLELKTHQLTVMDAVWLWDRIQIFWSNPSTYETDDAILELFSASREGLL